MPLGIRTPKTFNIVRSEKRVPMEVGVRISGHLAFPGIENTFTENVSLRGARVLTSRRWKINDHLEITTTSGFRSIARVAYCHTAPSGGFAIGLEFGERSGDWILGDRPGQLEPPPVTEENFSEVATKRSQKDEDWNST